MGRLRDALRVALRDEAVVLDRDRERFLVLGRDEDGKRVELGSLSVHLYYQNREAFWALAHRIRFEWALSQRGNRSGEKAKR